MFIDAMELQTYLSLIAPDFSIAGLVKWQSMFQSSLASSGCAGGSASIGCRCASVIVHGVPAAPGSLPCLEP
eukprot:2674327-Amphidinium_carterae.1